MEKLSAFWDLFRKGECLENAAFWKNVQNATTGVGLFIMAAVHALAVCGFKIPIDEGSATLIAGGIVAIVNIVLTYATTDKIGFLPAKQVLPSADAATATGVQAGPVAANEAHPGVNEPNGYSDNG